MPLGTDYARQSCSLARALEVLGERWTLLIVRDAFHGLTRYEEFQRSLGVATNVLSSRLHKLVEAGVLAQAGPRGAYELTDKGRDLYPVLLTLIAWGDRHEPGPDGPEVVIEHVRCGHGVGASLRCEHCGEPLAIGELRVASGPGALGPDGAPSELTPSQLAAWAGRD
jgi:DNA-binding HxlR family transcriptional regulator